MEDQTEPGRQIQHAEKAKDPLLSFAIRTGAAPMFALARISYDVEGAAEATGFSEDRIWRAIRDGELTARKHGKATIVESLELLRWICSMEYRGRHPVAA
jgi:hypothetical protein